MPEYSSTNIPFVCDMRAAWILPRPTPPHQQKRPLAPKEGTNGLRAGNQGFACVWLDGVADGLLSTGWDDGE